jgi:hypothetical protein
MTYIRIFLIVIVILLTVPNQGEAIDISKCRVMFGTRCELFLVERGWISNTNYPLKFFNSHWSWQTKDEIWHQLNIPCIIDDSEHEYLVLDYGGCIRVIKKKGGSKYDIKCIDGDWMQNPGGEGEWSFLE